MAAFVAAGLLYWLPRISNGMALAVLAFALLAGLVLWFFWRGHAWARWLVMAEALCVVLPSAALALAALLDVRFSPLWRAMVISEGCLGAFLLYWLNRSSVRAYFRSQGTIRRGDAPRHGSPGR